jgi:uncharacterized protein (TIGR02099 family)
MERTPRRFWTFAVTAGAVLVILAAAVSGVFQIAVQAVPGYRAKVERDVRELTGRDIRIEQLGLTWRYYYPSLDLNGVALLGADGQTPVLQAERLRLGFALTRLVRGDTTPDRLELQGLGINATVDRDGQVTVQGIEAAAPATGAGAGEALEALGSLARFSRVRLERCRVNLRDERRGEEVYSFGIVEATLDRGLLGDVLALDLALPASLGDSARLETFFTGELLQPSTWSGTVSGEVTGLVARTWLEPLLVRGARVEAARNELRFSGSLERGSLQSVRAELRAGPVTAQRAQHVARLESLELRGRAEAVADGWRARIERLSLEGASGPWSSAGEFAATRTPEGRWLFEAGAEYLRVDEFAPWLQIAAVPQALAGLDAVSGSLHDLQLRAQDAGDEWRYGYRARFEDLALPAGSHPGGFSGLRGEVAGDEHGGRAVLQESRAVLQLPGRFATPTLPFDALEAEVEWRRQRDGWTLGMPQFRWQLFGTRGRGRFSLELPAGGAPVLDLEAQFSAEDVTRAKPLMPTRWGTGLRGWLDRSIVGGRAPRATLVIHGPLADFPYQARPTGRWALDIDAADVELAYHPDWPAVNGLSARLHFEGNSLAIESTRGAVVGNAIERATARFPDFATGQLLIDGSVRGETARFYQFLQRSPLRDTLEGLLSQTTASGPAAVDVKLDIPVKEPLRTQVSGRVTLDGVALRHSGLAEPIRDIRGVLSFDGAGAINAERLTGQLYEVPIEARIAPQPAGGSLLSAALRLTVDPAGKGASELIPAWLRKQAAGASDWRATLALGGDTGAGVRLTTDLVGVELGYPPPFGKARDEARPLALTVGSARDAPLRITVDGAERLGADLKFARRGGAMALTRGVLRLGPGAPPSATEDGLVLTGELPEIDIKEWRRVLAASGIGEPDQAIRRADLRFGLARWSPFALRGLRYQWTTTRNGWALVLSGDQGVGEVRWNVPSGGTDRGLLTARLERLQVGYAPGEAEAEAGAAAAAVLDPNALPQFDLDVGRLVVGQANLGHVTFATLRTELGQKTRALKASGGIVTLAAEGEWRRRAGQSSGSVNGDLATSNIATLLRTFGYTPNLDAKAARFKTALVWAPSERGLEWEQAQGTVHLEFDNGQLRAVEPGAGRVLGLVNFYALPRRLTLNFRDVVSKGLGFDRITGDFELRDGSATTQNLRVAGPSVSMDVRGRIGLAARDYDQQVTVYPDVSSGVTLGAVLLGGPIAGALTLIAQELMGKPLNQVTQLTYRVTGTWDNPQVTQGTAPEPAPAEAAPASGKPGR